MEGCQQESVPMKLHCMAHDPAGAGAPLVPRLCVSCAQVRRRKLHMASSDGKVANREIRVWHVVVEKGY